MEENGEEEENEIEGDEDEKGKEAEEEEQEEIAYPILGSLSFLLPRQDRRGQEGNP